MPAFLLLIFLTLTVPATPSSDQCDAKPFTLNKPVKAPAKPSAQPPKKTNEVANKAVETKPKPKPKPLADCDQPKKKG